MFYLFLLLCSGAQCGMAQMPGTFATEKLCVEAGQRNGAAALSDQVNNRQAGGMMLGGFRCVTRGDGKNA